MATGNPDFDALLSTTLKHYTPKLEDNVFVELPLLYWLKEANHIEKVDGGEKLVEPLLYGQNTTAGSYSRYDNVNTAPQEGITSAVEEWKQFAVTIAIDGLSEAQNNGDAAIINLLKSKIDQAEMSASDAINAMLHADGTGNSSKDWKGLTYYIPNDPTTGTVSGIDRADATNAWWRSKVDYPGADEVLTIADMSAQYNLQSRGAGKDGPDLLLGTSTLWEKYEGLLQPAQRFSDPKTAEAGFQNLLYRSAPFTWDADTPAKVLYFLNSKYVKLKVHSNKWFKPTPFDSPIGQDARYSTIYSYGNLMVRNSSRLGALKRRLAA